MSKSTQDSGIPVLTEVIQIAPRAVAMPDVPIPTLTEAFTPNTPNEQITAIEAAPVEVTPIELTPINGWLDEEWSRLEQKISERVLTQLLERIDTVLEQRIKDSLAASLQLAVDEIRQGLHFTLDEVISDTVAKEIDNLRFSKK